jgi:hypothetical protein
MRFSTIFVRLVVCLALAEPVVAASADAYLCVAEMSAGLQFDSAQKAWRPNVFNTSDKVVVKRATPTEAAVGWSWAVWSLGNQTLPTYVCKQDFDAAGFLYCEGFGQFKFNNKNLRYISTYMFGFVDDALPEVGPEAGRRRVEGQDTPSVKGGRCSAL